MTIASIAAPARADGTNPQPDYAIYGERQGRWRLDTLFDDRDLAMFEAQQLAHNRHYSAVKVEVRCAGTAGARVPPTTIFQSGGAAAPEVVPLRRTRGGPLRSGRAKILTFGGLALGAAALALILGFSV